MAKTIFIFSEWSNQVFGIGAGIEAKKQSS